MGGGLVGRRDAMLIAGAALAAAANAREGCVGPEDLMLDFWRAYDRHAVGDPAARARGLIADYFAPHIEVYRGAGVGRVDLASWLTHFDPVVEDVRRLSQRLPTLWCARLARFRELVPDAAAEVPALALVSFLWFDGRVRPWRERVTLFLGLDMIVLLHGVETGLLLDHERFHLYHHEVNPSLILAGGDPLWLGIWKEGLAVHATSVLNPDAPRQSVFLSDAALAAAGPELFRRLASELPARLHETGGIARARYLDYGYRGDIPARSGYALGHAIVERAASGRSLAILARVPAPEAEAIIRRGVAALVP